MRSFAERLAFWGSAIFLITAQVYWCVHHQQLNGDLLYLEAFYRDVIVSGHPFPQFVFTEVTFLFPDLLLFLCVRPWANDAIGGLILYLSAFVTLYFSLLYLCFQAIWPRDKSRGHFLLGYLVLIALAQTTSQYLTMAYWPTYHGAIQLVLLFFFWQLLYLRKTGYTRLSLWLLGDFLFTMAVTFSDLLAVPVALLPVVAASLFFAWREPQARPNQFKLAFTIICGLSAGYALKVLALKTGVLLGVPFEAGTDDWPAVVLSAWAFPRSLPQIFYNDAIFFSACAVIGWVACQRRRNIPESGQVFRILAFFSLVIGALALILTGRHSRVGVTRYFQQLNYLPLLWVCLFGIPQLRLRTRQLRAVLLIGLVGLSCTLLCFEPGISLTDYPKLTACIDQHALELPTPWGLANFDIAKPVTFTSNEKLHLNQVKKNLSMDRWMNSLSWYSADIYQRPITRHSYLIARTEMQFDLSVKTWGPPSRMFMCPNGVTNLKVLIYPQGIAPLPPDNSQPN